jgi:hypothetical protein
MQAVRERWSDRGFRYRLATAITAAVLVSLPVIYLFRASLPYSISPLTALIQVVNAAILIELLHELVDHKTSFRHGRISGGAAGAGLFFSLLLLIGSPIDTWASQHHLLPALGFLGTWAAILMGSQVGPRSRLYQSIDSTIYSVLQER